MEKEGIIKQVEANVYKANITDTNFAQLVDVLPSGLKKGLKQSSKASDLT